MEVTAHTMLEMTKLWGLSWSLRDGFVANNLLSKEQNQYKVTHLPTFLEFAGFIHLSTGCMVGPYLEFQDYKQWIEFSGRYKSLPRGDFSTVVPAFTRMVHGWLCMAIYLGVMIGLNIDIYWAGSKEFVTYKTFFHRVGYSWIAMSG